MKKEQETIKLNKDKLPMIRNLIIIFLFIFIYQFSYTQAYDPYDETGDYEPVEEDIKTNDFKGHWQGFEFGLTNYVTRDISMNMPNDYKFLKVNPLRSWGFNINLLQQSVGIAGDQFGLVGGVGFEFSNYRFENDTITIIGKDGILQDTSGNYKKSKITTSFITVPLLLEFQFPQSSKRNDRVHLIAGVIGGLKIGDYTKTVNKDGEVSKYKKEAFFISKLRYGYTFRIGFKRFNIYANYYATPLFEKDKAPELHPVSIGIRFGI